MEALALIPARGGSKGIPHKNLAKVGGYSLTQRAIMSAQQASASLRVLVSSDSTEILSEARRCGAEALSRSPELALDTTPTIDVVRNLVQSEEFASYEYLVLLQATSPFRSPADIDACLDIASDSGSAVAICELEHPLEWSFQCDDEMRLSLPEGGFSARRQEASPAFRLAGSVYASSIDRLREGGALVDGSSVGHVVPRWRGIDIDEPLDLAIARSLAGTEFDPLESAPDEDHG